MCYVIVMFTGTAKSGPVFGVWILTEIDVGLAFRPGSDLCSRADAIGCN